MATNSTPSDLSAHVVQLGRVIDRLAPGTYEITIVKQEFRQQDWSFEIVRQEKISSGDLTARSLDDL
jgi:hypothetical protein